MLFVIVKVPEPSLWIAPPVVAQLSINVQLVMIELPPKSNNKLIAPPCVALLLFNVQLFIVKLPSHIL